MKRLIGRAKSMSLSHGSHDHLRSEDEDTLSDGLSSTTSRGSIGSTKLKSLFKPTEISRKENSGKGLIPGIGSEHVPLALLQNVPQKRMSTVDDSSVSTGTSETSSSQSEELDSSSEGTYSDEYEEEDEGEFHHLHLIRLLQPGSHIKNLGEHISTIMMFCGLLASSKQNLDGANEELQRTFSLLDDTLKIKRLTSTMHRSDPKAFQSAIGEKQVYLIKGLQNKIERIYSLKDKIGDQYAYIEGFNARTLFDRYGVVKDIIGTGAYGVIKVIDHRERKQQIEKDERGHSLKSTFYAVKELQKKPGDDLSKKDVRNDFINRIISEFIISSTLNHKNIARTVDFMVTLSPRSKLKDQHMALKFSQVMECSLGGDLFSYLTSFVGEDRLISQTLLDEMDCFVKQIAKGLCYMHRHGVAHCDLKLENVLISYLPPESNKSNKTQVILKVTDFGKSSVFKTKWDETEQLVSFTTGPMGSEPYIAPEEYLAKKNNSLKYSLRIKDCWALGVLIFVLFNLRKKSMSFTDSAHIYPWLSTEIKYENQKKNDGLAYKDKSFDEYVNKRMIATYDADTKEWTVLRNGTYLPIEHLFSRISDVSVEEKLDEGKNSHELEDEDSLSGLRRMIVYQLLDPDPRKRLDVEKLLKSDWIKYTEICGEEFEKRA